MRETTDNCVINLSFYHIVHCNIDRPCLDPLEVYDYHAYLGHGFILVSCTTSSILYSVQIYNNYRFGSFEIFKTRDRITGRVGPSVGRMDILHKLLDYVTSTMYILS